MKLTQTQEVLGNPRSANTTIGTALNALLNALEEYAENLSKSGAAAQEPAHQLVTVSEAAKLSGYSRRQLSRLIKKGLIPNYGSKTRPKVAVGDLPRKPGMAR